MLSSRVSAIHIPIKSPGRLTGAFLFAGKNGSASFSISIPRIERDTANNYPWKPCANNRPWNPDNGCKGRSARNAHQRYSDNETLKHVHPPLCFTREEAYQNSGTRLQLFSGRTRYLSYKAGGQNGTDGRNPQGESETGFEARRNTRSFNGSGVRYARQASDGPWSIPKHGVGSA